MCEAVVPKVVRPAKPLVTLEAGEGTLVRVGPLVDLQVVALGELPMAIFADVLLLPGSSPSGGRSVLGAGPVASPIGTSKSGSTYSFGCE